MQRRDYIKAVGSVAGATAVGGAGIFAMSGGVSADSGLTISAANTSTVSNDRGELTKVTADPSFRVEWKNFDQAVGKVLFLVEARTKDSGEWKTSNPASGDSNYFVPIFRATPWLTENVRQNGGPHVDYSKPGTTGYYEITSTLGKVMAYASRVRSDKSTEPRPLEVVNETGMPNYSSLNYYDDGSVDMNSFLNGNSVGPAEYYSGVQSLVNNFPQAAGGYYGAANSTAHFDEATDGKTDADTVELRYTVALLTVNDGMAPDTVGSGWYSGVTEEDVTTGHSTLAMEGDGEFPSVTKFGAGSPGSKYYPAYHAMADQHPAVLVDTAKFDVSVDNQISSSKGNGSSNTGAQ